MGVVSRCVWNESAVWDEQMKGESFRWLVLQHGMGEKQTTGYRARNVQTVFVIVCISLTLMLSGGNYHFR